MEYSIKYSTIAEQSLNNIFNYIDENANVVLIPNIFYIKRDTKNVINF